MIIAVGGTEETEEERRLLYVAMKRARDSLDLIVPQRFYTSGQSGRGDRHVYAGRTRFVPDSILDHFSMTSWPTAAESEEARPPMTNTIDIGERMRAMWGQR